MTGRFAFVWRLLRERLARLPALTLVGLLGIALGALWGAVGVTRGAEIPPEGDLIDAATFDAALGFFVVTSAVLATGVGWTRRGRGVWIGFLAGLTLYAYGIETLQALRGLDPRFSRVGGPADQIAGGIFFLAALGIMLCFIILAVKYFRAPATPAAIGVRYGAAASMIAFGIGIWMSLVTRGRLVPEAGNLLPLHAAGFHGLQAIPAVALLATWAGMAEHAARRLVHIGGLAWLGACVAIAYQSMTGHAILVPDPTAIAAAVLFLVWASSAVRAIWAWR